MPDILTNAPPWAATAFWAVVSIGSALFFIRNFFSGMKDEAKKIKRTGVPTPVAEITDGPISPAAPNLGSMGGFQMIGGGLIERQMAEDHIAIGNQLTKEIAKLSAVVEALGPLQVADLTLAVNRLCLVYEKRVSIDEREEHRAEIVEEARRMAQDMRDEERRQRPGGGSA